MAVIEVAALFAVQAVMPARIIMRVGLIWFALTPARFESRTVVTRIRGGYSACRSSDSSRKARMVAFDRPAAAVSPGSPPAARLLSALLLLPLVSCTEKHASDGERLARTYCAACHAFPEPQLLDRRTWEEGVLPQMAPRLGATPSSFSTALQHPYMAVLANAVSDEDWEELARYYLEHAPDTLRAASLPAQPRLDPAFFRTAPFVPEMPGNAIVTLLEADPVHERIYVGDAGRNQLLIFGWSRHLLSARTLGSPPTDVIVEGDRVLVLESGILHPNDQPRGRLAEYELAADDSLHFRRVLIDSLIRPVFVERFDFDGDGVDEFLVCEYGNDRGRLALYRYNGSTYERRVLDPSPGAIRFEIRDMTGDGAPDAVALFAQGDERIALFENDGTGHFRRAPRTLARFPPVYGSMHFSMHDFNSDGYVDIAYVNGDNFDYSRVLKPYHGVRILANDGENGFEERYFFPMYGAARAEVADFDRDGDLDMLTTSNFADAERYAERGIMYFENVGPFEFRPYAFTIASTNQWNRIATGDLNADGRLDAVIGAMSLESIVREHRGSAGAAPATRKDALLYFENDMLLSSRRSPSTPAGFPAPSAGRAPLHDPAVPPPPAAPLRLPPLVSTQPTDRRTRGAAESDKPLPAADFARGCYGLGRSEQPWIESTHEVPLSSQQKIRVHQACMESLTLC